MKLSLCLWLATSCAVLAATEEHTNKTFSVTPGGSLIVDVDFGSIEVGTNAADELKVDVWRKVTRKAAAAEEQFLHDYPVKLAQEGNTVTVHASHKESHGWFGNSGERNEAKYIIMVPARFIVRAGTAGGPISVTDVTGEVKADTSGGGLKFERIHGPLNGDTSGGAIHVRDCEGAIKMGTSGGGISVEGGSGSLKGDTSGGGVSVKDFGGPASVETSGGGITIENVKGKVEGSTSGGPINAVLLAPLPGDVSLETSGGGVTVKVPEAAAFTLDAETSGGGVRSDLPVTVQGKMERDELKGTVNGGGPKVTLRSSGGGIHVKKL